MDKVQIIKDVIATPSDNPLAHKTLVSFETSAIAMYRYKRPIPTTVKAAANMIDILDTCATVPDSTIVFPEVDYLCKPYLTV